MHKSTALLQLYLYLALNQDLYGFKRFQKRLSWHFCRRNVGSIGRQCAFPLHSFPPPPSHTSFPVPAARPREGPARHPAPNPSPTCQTTTPTGPNLRARRVACLSSRGSSTQAQEAKWVPCSWGSWPRTASFPFDVCGVAYSHSPLTNSVSVFVAHVQQASKIF